VKHIFRTNDLFQNLILPNVKYNCTAVFIKVYHSGRFTVLLLCWILSSVCCLFDVQNVSIFPSIPIFSCVAVIILTHILRSYFYISCRSSDLSRVPFFYYITMTITATTGKLTDHLNIQNVQSSNLTVDTNISLSCPYTKVIMHYAMKSYGGVVV
jgi:hypothetical protein